MATHPIKYWKQLLLFTTMKTATSMLFSQFGYLPSRNILSKNINMDPDISNVLDVLFQYRYYKIDPQTKQLKIASVSGPITELDKILNREWQTILKYSIAPIPGMIWQLLQNRGIDNKRITDIPFFDLTNGLKEGYYGSKEIARTIGQVGTYALSQFFPPFKEVLNNINSSEINTVERIINTVGGAYIYEYKQDIATAKRNLQEARRDGKSQFEIKDLQGKLNEAIKNARVVQLMHRAVRKDKIKYDDALRFYQSLSASTPYKKSVIKYYRKTFGVY